MEKSDGIVRCDWSGTDPLYTTYHDQEWGREVNDDPTMFEFLVLESSQAGLSWITILRRRENYRRAFEDFDVHKVAGFTEEDVERLMQDNRIEVKPADSLAKVDLNELDQEDSEKAVFATDGVGQNPPEDAPGEVKEGIDGDEAEGTVHARLFGTDFGHLADGFQSGKG
ncbi:MAG: hypothetical protein EOM23_11690, partial [Candidatus Moranbacteria bacterium]|nr:hypothetical protein [Candidatus Moranbacteria bacterium]